MSHDGEMAAIPLVLDINPPDIKTKSKEFSLFENLRFCSGRKVLANWQLIGHKWLTYAPLK